MHEIITALNKPWINITIFVSVGSILFTAITFLGSFSFALGTSHWFRRTEAMFPLMMTGRFLLGAGVIAVRIVQDRVVTFWFRDRLEFAWGVTVSTFRIGTVLNFLISANIAFHYGLDVATWVAAAVSALGFVSSIVLVGLDIYGSKKVDVYAINDTTKKKFVSTYVWYVILSNSR
ncbi:hypothetical protein FSP39_016954 [Pinctada imbricata]|uniref:Uncharacterized protein n=1 Tax=Pinctada imbricata TaxID=66713 RepID=A0AA89BUA0_PINIB|nr:hypothetical protein FSP39_016954 [Pinctada imbricata]